MRAGTRAPRAYTTKEIVPGLVTQGIVHALEVIQIHVGQADGAPLAPAHPQSSVRLFMERPTVQQQSE